jgi:hypothetical protein
MMSVSMFNVCTRVVLFQLMLVLAAQPSWATTMTFAAPDRDVALLQGIPGSNFGGFDANQAGLSVSAPTRSLISFNVAALAGQYDVIDSITLRLFFEGFDDTATKTPGIYAVNNANAGWVAGTANNAQQTGSSTWNHRISPTTNWNGSAGLSTPGASFSTPGADYASTLLSSITFNNLAGSPPAANTPFDFVFTGTQLELTSLIDNWLDVANGGLLLRDVNEGSLTGAFNRIRFHSNEDLVNLRPMLIVEFHLAAPEPSTFVLGLLGMAGMMHVRRRQTRR